MSSDHGNENLGTRESFVGGFKIDEQARAGRTPRVFGPFEIDKGQTTIMRSSSDAFEPTEGEHIRSSELCATCHTLITQALDAEGKVIGELPEQVPYQEWLHSDFRETRSCQSCHMPVVAEDVPITSVLRRARAGVSRHTFVGRQFLHAADAEPVRERISRFSAQPQEMDAAARQHDRASAIGDRQRWPSKAWPCPTAAWKPSSRVENLGGHKLPTAYPSRRVWLHVSGKDA